MSRLKRSLAIVLGTFTVGYLIVAPPIFRSDSIAQSTDTASRGAVELTCPPDIYASEYLAYLERADTRMEIRLEPQLYGSISAMETLTVAFREERHALSGISLTMTAKPFDKVWTGHCTESCSARDYQALARECAAALGDQCFDFAIVIDGVSQCLMTPRPEPLR